jgi:hypothetical protein
MITRFAEGVWYDTGPVSMVGMQLTATMTVLRLDDGGLLLHSPLPLTAPRRSAVTELGQVKHLYAPNTFHHSWLGEWAREFPTALVHAPRYLASKRPDLRIDRFHDEDRTQAFGELVDEVPIDGFRLAETALIYRPGRTAVVTDLVHNIGRPTHAWTRFYSRTMGFYDRVALSRVLRWTAFSDRKAARRSVDALLEHPFEGLIVGHGTPIPEGGREALANALAFLPASATSGAVVAAKPSRVFGAKPCG